jgi:hypothetical protein
MLIRKLRLKIMRPWNDKPSRNLTLAHGLNVIGRRDIRSPVLVFGNNPAVSAGEKTRPGPQRQRCEKPLILMRLKWSQPRSTAPRITMGIAAKKPSCRSGVVSMASLISQERHAGEIRVTKKCRG